MMPDLGKYADTVLSSYAVSLALLAILIWVSLRRSKRVKMQLDMQEKKVKRDG